MRKSVLLAATAAATAMLVMTPLAASAATTDVLTTVKVGGANVAVGAHLSAGLKTGTKATFKNSEGTVTCTKSSIAESVTANPAKPGTATLSMTGQSFSGCTVSTSGITIKSVTAYKLPFKTTVSDAKGLPVTVTKPGAVVVASALGMTVTCTYQAPKISGTASNTGSSVAFTNQTLTKLSGSSFCPSSGTLSATYAPLVDTSVKGDPHVFVN